MDQADPRGRLGVDQVDLQVLEAGPGQGRVDDALVGQKDLPGEQPQHVAAPEWGHRQHEEQPVTRARGHVDDRQHHRIAQQHGEEGGSERYPQRLGDGQRIIRLGEHVLGDVEIVLEREGRNDLEVLDQPEAQHDQEDQRGCEEGERVGKRDADAHDLHRTEAAAVGCLQHAGRDGLTAAGRDHDQVPSATYERRPGMFSTPGTIPGRSTTVSAGDQ